MIDVESERFEALIDAIIAIIITLIVMEIPLPETTTLEALFKLTPEFIAYILSFIICFNFWNYHHNLFNVVNRIDSRVTWISSVGIMIIGLLPHVTTMISNNFYSLTAQAMFGLIFFLTNINFYVADVMLLRIDKANIALHILMEDRRSLTIITSVLQICGLIVGYLVYPPAILVACILSIVITFCWSKIKVLI